MPYTTYTYGNDPNAAAFVETLKPHQGKGVNLSLAPETSDSISSAVRRDAKLVWNDLSSFAKEGPGFLRYLPVTLAKEVAAHGGGTITLARGGINLVNAVKNIAIEMEAARTAALTGAFKGIFGKRRDGESFYDRLTSGAGEGHDTARKYMDKILPDIPLLPYLDHFFPNALDNQKHLTENEKRFQSGARYVSEDSMQDIVTLGAGKLIKPLRFLYGASKLDLSLNPVQMGVSYYMGAEDRDNQKAEEDRKAGEEAFKKFLENKKNSKLPWYHHAAVGYGAGGVAGGATGYLLSTLMDGDKATKVISTVGGGAVGSVLGRIIQKKMLEG